MIQNGIQYKGQLMTQTSNIPYFSFHQLWPIVCEHYPHITEDDRHLFWEYWRNWNTTSTFTQLTITDRLKGVTTYDLQLRLLDHIVAIHFPIEQPTITQPTFWQQIKQYVPFLKK